MPALSAFSAAIAAAASMSAMAAEGQQPGVLAGTRTALTQTNSLYGPTGLFTIPTAYTASHRQLAFGANFSDRFSGPSFNYGIVPYIEVGGTYLQRTNAANKAIANAKVNFIPSNFNGLEVGIGVIDAADAIGQSFYFVGSADFTPPTWDPTGRVGSPVALKAHAGVGTGVFNERLFAGAELLFPNQFSLVGEYDTNDFNIGLRYVHDDRVRFQVGFVRKKLFFGATTLIQF